MNAQVFSSVNNITEVYQHFKKLKNIEIHGVEEHLDRQKMIEIEFTYKKIVVGTFRINLSVQRQRFSSKEGASPKQEFLLEFTQCTYVSEMLHSLNSMHTKLAQCGLIQDTIDHANCTQHKVLPKSLEDYCWHDLKIDSTFSYALRYTIPKAFVFKKPTGCLNYDLEYRETYSFEDTQYGPRCIMVYQGQWLKGTMM